MYADAPPPQIEITLCVKLVDGCLMYADAPPPPRTSFCNHRKQLVNCQLLADYFIL